MPAAKNLPKDLEDLAKQQATELRMKTFDRDLAQLTDSVEQALGISSESSRP